MSKPLSQNEDMKPAGGMETLCAPCWTALHLCLTCFCKPTCAPHAQDHGLQSGVYQQYPLFAFFPNSQYHAWHTSLWLENSQGGQQAILPCPHCIPCLRCLRRDKAGSKAGIYRDVKHSTEEKADETTGDKPISQLYQNANATAQVNSVPGSTDAFDKVK